MESPPSADRRQRPGLAERNRARRGGPYYYEDADWMNEAYVIRGLSLRQVAAEAGCSLRTIARWMKVHGIATRTAAPPPVRAGKEHPRWRGAAICPGCGGLKSRGKTRTCIKCRVRRGADNPKWRGDEAGYTAIHYRLNAARGKPSEHSCARCGKAADEWAYDHADPGERRNGIGRDDGPFSLDLARYMPLCKRCHRQLDNGRAADRRADSRL